MDDRAKLFTSGGSQAVRLPKAYRFQHEREVRISRDGERVILEPTGRRWSGAFVQLAGSAIDFPYPEEISVVESGPDFD
jgi:virulence-associated protein VagC